MNAETKEGMLTIGYFGIRAKAQVCRLLCEYLGLPYHDRFFTPDEWEHFQTHEAKDWVIKALPFLIDGEFVVTGQQGIIEYIVRKSASLSLLGSTARDRIKLDSFKSKYDIKDNVLALVCQLNRNAPKDAPLKPPEFYWEAKIYPKLKEIEVACNDNAWFLGYLTIADFALYQMMNNLLWLFPDIAASFPRLARHRQKVLGLAQISAYENSERAVKAYNPICFFKEFQQKVEGSLVRNKTN